MLDFPVAEGRKALVLSRGEESFARNLTATDWNTCSRKIEALLLHLKSIRNSAVKLRRIFRSIMIPFDYRSDIGDHCQPGPIDLIRGHLQRCEPID